MDINEHEFFGEWVEYTSPEEKEEARTYLSLWKKFIIKKLTFLEFVEEMWIDRENSISPLNKEEPLRSTLGLKISMKEKSEN